jgi:hypothetical protein
VWLNGVELFSRGKFRIDFKKTIFGFFRINREREVENTNRKSSVIALALMAVAMLVAPALAIGPLKAENKNPNLTVYTAPEGSVTQMSLESGTMKIWVNTPNGDAVKLHILDASKAHIGNAITDLTSYEPSASEYENKWVYITQEQLATLFTFFGFDSTLTSLYPEGFYAKANYVK